MNRLNFRSKSNNSSTSTQYLNKGQSKINKISLVISFLLLSVLTIQSCKKSKEDLRVNSDPIESARIALADATKGQHSNIDTSMYRQSLHRTILWEKALLRRIGDSTIVYAPIRLSKELKIKEGGQPGVSVNNISWLVVTKFKEKYKFDMVLRIPNKEAATTGKFNGVLIVDDWFGKRQSFYIDKDKQKTYTNNRKDANGDVITTMGSSCRTTSYTICAGNDNYCYTTYETTCTYTSEPPITDEPYDPYGGDNPGGQAPGTGGGGDTSSPEAVFMSKIDKSKLSPCFNSVLTGLQAVSNNCIANTLEIFSGEIPGYNWKMQDGSAGGNNGVTSSAYDRTNKSVTTTFDSSNFTSGSDLAIAKTILHESVHAYLVAHFNIDQSTAKTDYPQYVEDYYSTERPDMNAAQHNELVRNFVSSIADQLKQFGISKGYNLTDQFYNDLSWGGLTNTNAFKSFSSDAQDRIKNVILSEQSGADTNGNPSPPKGKLAGC